MPAKYRRSLRKIPKATQTGKLIKNTPTDIDSSTNGIAIKSPIRYGEKPLTTIDPNLGKYAISEIKWIAVVAGIVIVLMVVSYIVFR
jgi:hypothetical protein